MLSLYSEKPQVRWFDIIFTGLPTTFLILRGGKCWHSDRSLVFAEGRGAEDFGCVTRTFT